MNILAVKPIQKTIGKLILIFLALLSVSSVKAASTYTFTSGDIVLEHLPRDFVNYSPDSSLGTFNSSLTFASPLAANSTTPIKAESGGFAFFGNNTGGVIGYFSHILEVNKAQFSLSHDILRVGSSINDGILSLDNYSTVEGEVLTDNIGNIVEWDLEYVFYNVFGSSVRIEAGVTEPGFNGLNPMIGADQLNRIKIRSAPPRDLTIDDPFIDPPVELTFPFADQQLSFFNDSSIYTSEVGSFAPPVNTVPEPTTLMLFLVAGFTWVTNQMRVKKRFAL